MTRSLKDKLTGSNKPKLGTTDTLIDTNTQLTGNVVFEGTLVVNGRILGAVQSTALGKNDDTLIINETGVIIADKLTIKHIIVKGELIAAAIECSTMEITSTGRVICSPGGKGKLVYKTLKIAEGAMFVGIADVSEPMAFVVSLAEEAHAEQIDDPRLPLTA